MSDHANSIGGPLPSVTTGTWDPWSSWATLPISPAASPPARSECWKSPPAPASSPLPCATSCPRTHVWLRPTPTRPCWTRPESSSSPPMPARFPSRTAPSRRSRVSSGCALPGQDAVPPLGASRSHAGQALPVRHLGLTWAQSVWARHARTGPKDHLHGPVAILPRAVRRPWDRPDQGSPDRRLCARRSALIPAACLSRPRFLERASPGKASSRQAPG